VEAAAQPQVKIAEKLDLFQAVELASKHCENLVMAMKNPYSLVVGYKKHYKNSDFDKKFSDEQKLDLLSYFEGRTNLPDFTFLISYFQTTITRENRIKFNALMTDRFILSAQLDASKFPFESNCQIAKFEPNMHELSLKTVIAFGTEQVKLQYNMIRKKGYSWQIEGLVLNDISLNKQYAKQYSDTILSVGMDNFIENLCKSSSFSKLGCK